MIVTSSATDEQGDGATEDSGTMKMAGGGRGAVACSRRPFQHQSLSLTALQALEASGKVAHVL